MAGEDATPVSDLVGIEVPFEATVVVTSDLHLPPEATAASSRAVEALAARIGEGAQTVVLAGDILELLGFPEATPAQILHAHPVLVEVLNRVVEVGGQVVYVIGNHDGDLAWNTQAAAEVAGLLPVVMTLAADLYLSGAPGQEPRRVRVEHGHQLDPYNCFVDQRNRLDTPLGHHVVRQLLPRVESLGRGWLQDSRELVDAVAFPSFLASRLTYRRLGRHLWWLLTPVLAIAVLHAPEVVELLSGSSSTGVWLRRTQTFVTAALVDLALLGVVVWVLCRRTWRSLSSLGLQQRGGGQNVVATERAVSLVDDGWSGLITGHSHSPELSAAQEGFYANTGSTTVVVQPISARLHLPPVYMRSQQVCWVECTAASTLTVRLVMAYYSMPGATRLERLVARETSTGPSSPTVVAHWPRIIDGMGMSGGGEHG